MSIDVTDYSSRLNDLKKDYQDKFDSQSRSHAREKQIIEQKNKSNLEGQRSAYDNQRAVIEKDAAELRQRYQKKTDEAVQNYTNKFKDEIASEKIQSENDLYEARKNYNEKMNKSKLSFDKNLARS